MTRKHRCIECGSTLTIRKGPRRYGHGVNVVLNNVEVRICGDCGEEYEVIPNIENLHKVIATSLAKKPVRLTPGEIRFLRTYLGHSSQDFAEILGIRPETITRWENPATGGMSSVAERFLRYAVLVGKPITSYGLENIDTDPDELPQPPRFHAEDDGWVIAEAK
jgi:putative zinc finger/helix-turn-helix YgiT family protein